MSQQRIKQYVADDLVRARKLAGRTMRLASSEKHVSLLVRLHRVDAPGVDIALLFESFPARRALPPVAQTQRATASLLWHNNRIRGIDWTIKHDVIRNSFPTGEVIRGWHEHYWTDSDGPDSIRKPDPEPPQPDMSAIVMWCCKQWNIEGIAQNLELFS